MRLFADYGLTTSAVQQVADEIGVSQPYIFRLFGSKQAFFLACLDEMEAQIRAVCHRAAEANPRNPLPSMGSGFRDLIADGVVVGLWLQACAAARADETVALRCRSLVSDVLDDVGRLAGVGRDDVTQALANGALVVMLQAVGADIAGGTRAALKLLRAETGPPSSPRRSTRRKPSPRLGND
jgi:AcrR family transcriptional regulator